MIRRVIWPMAAAAVLVVGFGVPKAAAQDAKPDFPLSEPDLDALIEKEKPALEARKMKIETELAVIEADKAPDVPWAKEWAGTYYTGDGLGMNVVITIAPKSGVAYTWHGCLGLYDANHGDIVETFPDGVEVKLAIDPKASHWGFLSERLYFVRWSERRYLVPEAQMVTMANNYNAGSYARESMYDIPLKFAKGEHVRRHTPEPAGRPILPPKYAKLIIEKPVRLAITKVGTEPAQDITGAPTLQCRLELRGGRDKNVFAGMRIKYQRGSCFGFITIDTVGETTSEGTVMMFGVGEKEILAPEVGAELVFPGTAPEHPREEEPASKK